MEKRHPKQEKGGKRSRQGEEACAGTRQEKTPRDKLHQDKEAGGRRKQKETHQEINRMDDLRREIEMARQELDLGSEFLKEKEKKEEQRDKIHEQEESRLREQRRNLEKGTSMKKQRHPETRARRHQNLRPKRRRRTC